MAPSALALVRVWGHAPEEETDNLLAEFRRRFIEVAAAATMRIIATRLENISYATVW